MAVSAQDIQAYIDSVLSNKDLTDAQRAAQINEAAKQHDVSIDQISSAVKDKYSDEQVRNYLGAPAATPAPAPSPTQAAAAVISGQEGWDKKAWDDANKIYEDIMMRREASRDYQGVGNYTMHPSTGVVTYMHPQSSLGKIWRASTGQWEDWNPNATRESAPTYSAPPPVVPPVTPAPAGPAPTGPVPVAPTPGATGGLPGPGSPRAPVTPINLPTPTFVTPQMQTGIMQPQDTEYDKWMRQQRDYLGGITLPSYSGVYAGRQLGQPTAPGRPGQPPVQQIVNPGRQYAQGGVPAENGLIGYDPRLKPYQPGVDDGGYGSPELMRSRGGIVKGYAEGGLHELNMKYAPPGLAAMAEGTGGLDMSRVTPEQLAMMQAEDPLAMTRGIQRFVKGDAGPEIEQDLVVPTSSGGGEPSAPEGPSINDLLAKYMSSPSAYAGEYAEARKASSAHQAKLEELLTKAMEGSQKSGPSKAEMYFSLAAALSKPTKTGNFFDSMGNVAEALGSHTKAQREAQSANEQAKRQLALTVAQMKATGARQDVSDLRQLTAEEMKDRRTVGAKMLDDYLKSGQPQSEAGKAAADAGLKRGTPEYGQFVEQYLRNKLEGDPIRMLTAEIAKGNAALGQQREKREQEKFEEQKKQNAKLSPAELKLKIETEDNLNSTKSAFQMMKDAERLNPNTFDASMVDKFQRTALEAVGSKDEKVQNTRELENILGNQALERLKATFGAAPTEGERNILMDLQGIGAKSVEERGKIIKRAQAILNDRYKRQKSRLADINAGKVRATDASTAQPESLESE